MITSLSAISTPQAVADSHGGMRYHLFFLLAAILFYILYFAIFGTITPYSDSYTNMFVTGGVGGSISPFQPFFSLAANARPWFDDIMYHPYHLLRVGTILLGKSETSYQAFIILTHVAFYAVAFHYITRVFKCSSLAGFIGGMSIFLSTGTFFSSSLVRFTEAWSAILLAITLLELFLFQKRGSGKHLAIALLANGLQPYMANLIPLLPTQIMVMVFIALLHLNKVGKPALFRKILIYYPTITFLFYIPILLPILLNFISGEYVRDPGTTGETLLGLKNGLNILLPFFPFWELLQYAADAIQQVTRYPMMDATPEWGAHAAMFQVKMVLWNGILVLPALLTLHGYFQRRIFFHFGVFAILFAWVMSLLPSGGLFSQMASATHLFSRIFVPFISALCIGLAFDRMIKGEFRWHRQYNRYVLALLTLAVLLIAFATFWKPSDPAPEGAHTWGRSGLLWIGLALFLYLLLVSKKRQKQAALIATAIVMVQYGYSVFMFQYPDAKRVLTEDVVSCFRSWSNCYDSKEVNYLLDKGSGFKYRLSVIIGNGINGNWTNDNRPHLLNLLANGSWRDNSGYAFSMPLLHYLPGFILTLQQNFMDEEPALNKRLVRSRVFLSNPNSELLAQYGGRYFISDVELDQYYPHLRKVFQGDYLPIYENSRANPVAFFEQNRQHALEFRSEMTRYFLDTQGGSGLLLINVDLKDTPIFGLQPDGGEVPLKAQRINGFRWRIDVPQGIASLRFHRKGAMFFLYFGILPILTAGLLLWRQHRATRPGNTLPFDQGRIKTLRLPFWGNRSLPPVGAPPTNPRWGPSRPPDPRNS